MTLTVYEYNFENEWMNRFIDNLNECDLTFRASELKMYGIRDMGDIDRAVIRAMKACRTCGISVRRNFKGIFIYDRNGVRRDWKLSEMARRLVLINADTSNPVVAQAQLTLIIE